MGDAHQMIINHVGKVIGGHAILLNQHHIVHGLGIGEGHVSKDGIMIAGFPFGGGVHANGPGKAGIQLALNLRLGKMKAMLVVLPGAAGGLHSGPAGVNFFLGAEAVIGMAGLHQLLGVGQIQILPLALNIGTAGAAYVRAFIPGKAAAFQGFIDDLCGPGNKALLIRILNAEDELAAVFAGIEIIIQRGAQAAQMHKAGGAGGESGSDVHDFWKLPS